jgi:hypothetical protein
MRDENSDMREQIESLRRSSKRYALGGWIVFLVAGLWVPILVLIVLIYRPEVDIMPGTMWSFVGMMLVGMYLRLKSHQSLYKANDLESKQDFWATRGT